MERFRSYVRSWWGAALPLVVLTASDLGLPEAPWWVPWLLAAASLASYVAGRINAGDDEALTDAGRTRESARRVSLLPEATLALLWELYWKGRLTTAELREVDDEASALLGGCEEMGLVESEAKVYVGVVWRLTEPCRRVLDGMAEKV